MSSPSETTTNFLGIPIEGDIYTQSGRAEQRPQEELEPLVLALLDDPYFVEFGWRQYTPYFNDGDPCVFSSYGFWVKTQDDLLNEEEDDEWDSENYSVDYGTHPSLGGEEYPNGYSQPKLYVGSREPQYRTAKALSDAIEGGAFLDVLLNLFGDHAEITVRRKGIEVQEYSHD